uniref:Uncharacterized protein n=2 Tax=Ciona savignyi TaxID=51511 RepID=H2YIB1_CIOSA
MKMVVPLTESQNVPLVKASPHLPLKRMAACPASQHTIAVPKRSRLTAASEAHLRHLSYNMAMASPNVVVSSRNYGLTASPNPQTPRGLSVVPSNSTRSGNCCGKENLCFGSATSSTGFSTPPYGSQNQFTYNYAPSASRRSSLKSLVRRSKKRSPYKSRTSNKSKRPEKIPEDRVQDSFQSQPKALVVYNEFLRQLESENQTKNSGKSQNTTKSSGRYSRGFTPSVTSTPQHNTSPPSSRESIHPESTSDYFSAPSSGASAEDSFVDFLKYIETGVSSDRRKRLLLNETSDLKTSAESSSSRQTKPAKKRFVTSTPESEQLSDVRNNNLKSPTLPGMYPIGAPRHASSPVNFKQPAVSAGGASEFTSAVWRPWC